MLGDRQPLLQWPIAERKNQSERNSNADANYLWTLKMIEENGPKGESHAYAPRPSLRLVAHPVIVLPARLCGKYIITPEVISELITHR
jgi:hypothetical protein